MIKLILALIVIFWLLGFIQIPLLSSVLFSIASHPFTLQSLLLVILIGWIIGLLPGIFKTIVMIIFIVWLLSLFGILAIGGLMHILIIIIIIAVVFSFL